MKKKIYYISLIALALVFTACSAEGDDVTLTKTPASSASAPALSSKLVEARTFRFTESSAPFKEIAFTETNKAILTLNKNIPMASSKRRAEGEKDEYIIGTYTFDGNKNTYTITKDGEADAYCTVEVTNKETGKKATVRIHLMSGDEIEEFDTEIAEKVESDVVSTKLCREWKVVNTRLTHKDGVTAVKHFENPDSAASLNAILNYAKTVATITEELDEGMVITSIEFTSDGKFCFFFKNGKHYIGKWNWTNLNKGYLNYDWDNQNMGNKFMKDGEAIFDVREFKKVKYYVLTLAAKIEEKNKTYSVELSFYLNEKGN